jgi:hypothetical protein
MAQVGTGNDTNNNNDAPHRSSIVQDLLMDLNQGNVARIRSQILSLREYAHAGQLDVARVVPLLKKIMGTYSDDATLTVRCLHLCFLFRLEAPTEFATIDWVQRILQCMHKHIHAVFVQALCFAWLLWLVADAGGNVRALVCDVGGIEAVLEVLLEHRRDAQIQEAAGLFFTRLRQQRDPHALPFGDSEAVVPILLNLQANLGVFGIGIRMDHLRGNEEQHEGAEDVLAANNNNNNNDDDEEEEESDEDDDYISGDEDEDIDLD